MAQFAVWSVKSRQNSPSVRALVTHSSRPSVLNIILCSVAFSRGLGRVGTGIQFRKRLRDSRALWFSKSVCQVIARRGKKSWNLAWAGRWVKPCNLTNSVVQLLVVFSKPRAKRRALYCMLQPCGKNLFIRSHIKTACKHSSLVTLLPLTLRLCLVNQT